MVEQGYGSVEERLRRLETEVAGHRRVLDLLRPGMGVTLAEEEAVEDRDRRRGFAALETGAEAAFEAAPAAAEVSVGQRVGSESAGATFAPGSEDAGFESSRAAGGEGWNRRLPFAFDGIGSWEWWLNKVGIALLLFGVAFLFKFSWDRGWLQALLTPWVRVGLGAMLGGGLIALGLRVDPRRGGFAAVLLGGGIGTLYITTFAAYSVLDLLPHAVAFGAMVAVTALAFALSVRQDESVLSLIATVGGLATPFVLYTEDGSLAGLVLYTSLVLAGTAAIYLFEGWGSLLAVSSVGTWWVLFVAVLQLDHGQGSGGTAWAVQFGVAFAWLVLWLVPAAREVLQGSSWPLPSAGPLARLLGGTGTRGGAGMTHALALGTPLLALASTAEIWSLTERELGYAALGGAGLYSVVALFFRSVEREGSVAYVSRLASLVLATVGVVAVFEGNTLFAALALEAAALHLLGRRLSDRVVAWAAHGLSAFVAAWLGFRLLSGIAESLLRLLGAGADPPVSLGVGAFVDLGAIALFPLVAHYALRRAANAYCLVAWGALSLWLAREVMAFESATSYLLLSWAVYAAVLFVASRRFQNASLTVALQVQILALGTLVFGQVLWTIGSGPDGTSVFNLGAVASLLAILSIAAYSVLARQPLLAVVYRVAAWTGFLGWSWGQLASLPSGDAYVTILWGVCGTALLVCGPRTSATDWMRLGFGTLFLVVGKLFLWDLAGVDAIWRVLLFLGFGGLFLLLSYYLQSLWGGGRQEPRGTDSGAV